MTEVFLNVGLSTEALLSTFTSTSDVYMVTERVPK